MPTVRLASKFLPYRSVPEGVMNSDKVTVAPRRTEETPKILQPRYFVISELSSMHRRALHSLFIQWLLDIPRRTSQPELSSRGL